MANNRSPIVFSVRRAIPKGLGASSAEWRQTLSQAVRPIRSPAVNGDTEFKVEATFHLLPQDKWHLVDLDNLAKVLLDTLFKPRHPPVLEDGSRFLFDADDGQVIELTLRKRLVDEEKEQGVDVRVTWTPGG